MSHASRLSGHSPDAKKHYMVPDASALIALMKNFTDIYNNTNQTLEKLVTANSRRSAPLLDKILIPDHTLYEVTGITTMAMPTMLQRFKDAQADPEKLEEWVDLYVASSPRNDARLPDYHIRKAQIRGVLRFVARHPDWIISTNVSERYSSELKVDYAVLAGVGSPEVLQRYRPALGDVVDILGDTFSLNNLRVHYGQLWMMGMVRESDYSARMQKEEKAKGNQRFITVSEWARLLEKQGKISPEEKEKIKHIAQQSDARSDQGSQYLTIGMLRALPEVLERYSFSDNTHMSTEAKRWRRDIDSGAGSVINALRPSKLLLEQLFYGGVIPLEAMSDVSSCLGYTIEEGAKAKRVSAKQQLHRQGFFERTVSCADLQKIHDYLVEKKYDSEDLSQLAQLTGGLEHIAQQYKNRLNQVCQNRDSSSLYLSGTPYEKMLAQELINGTIDFEEFTAILGKTNHGLVTFQGKFATQEGDIVVERNAQGRTSTQARIWINQEGFAGRDGHTDISAYHYDTAETMLKELVRGAGHKDYLEFCVGELIDICRRNRRFDSDNKIYRVFESLLYPSVLRDASRVREAALEVLGEDRLVQLEKDFSNRHIRRIQLDLPPCADVFAAQHVNRRIARKNLGEIATAEVACKLAEENGQDATIWIANHDMDLMPKQSPHAKKTDMDGAIYFSERLHRMTSHLEPELRALETQMGEQKASGTLDFVGTQQLLGTAQKLTGRMKLSRDNTPIIKKEIAMREGRTNRLPDNARWEAHAKAVLPNQTGQGVNF